MQLVHKWMRLILFGSGMSIKRAVILLASPRKESHLLLFTDVLEVILKSFKGRKLAWCEEIQQIKQFSIYNPQEATVNSLRLIILIPEFTLVR